jgi:hypothetical protein
MRSKSMRSEKAEAPAMISLGFCSWASFSSAS